jgi:hypothetical protein
VARRQAAAIFDADPGADSAVAALVRAADRADAVTLWHALQRAGPGQRAALFDRLAAITPPPEGTTRTGVLAGDALMLRLWWEQLPLTLPITPDRVKRMWMAWLKVASWL